MSSINFVQEMKSYLLGFGFDDDTPPTSTPGAARPAPAGEPLADAVNPTMYLLPINPRVGDVFVNSTPEQVLRYEVIGINKTVANVRILETGRETSIGLSVLAAMEPQAAYDRRFKRAMRQQGVPAMPVIHIFQDRQAEEKFLFDCQLILGREVAPQVALAYLAQTILREEQRRYMGSGSGRYVPAGRHNGKTVMRWEPEPERRRVTPLYTADTPLNSKRGKDRRLGVA